MLKEGESVPEIFEDPVVKRASRWVLSTSTLFSKHLREYGWGEVRGFPVFFSPLSFIACGRITIQVVPDGFGIPYVTGFDGMMCHPGSLWILSLML